MRLADYVVRRLEAAGITHAFTVCGGGSIFLNDALARAEKIRYVSCHHEQAAAMAAEGYARVRGGIGLAVVTSGPGGTNAITGVAGAWTDHVPTLTISGQVFSTQTINGREGLRTVGVQEINIVDIVRPITKYAVMVREPSRIRFHLEKALYLAKEGRPGPVWLDVPADVQNAEVDPAELEPFQEEPRSSVSVCTATVEAVWEALKKSKRPVLHVGQGIRIAGAIPELNNFLIRTGIPVLTARNGNDLIESDHPQYIGRPGTFAQRGANFAVQTCDFYLAIGTRLSLAQTGYNAKDYARNAFTVQVDISRGELNKNTARIDLPVHADARDFLRGLLGQIGLLEVPGWSQWLERCKEWQSRYPPVSDEQRKPGEYVNSYHLVDALSNAATKNDIIVTDMGYSFQNVHQAWKVKAGQRLFTNCGLAAMGWGLPAAIGAAFGSGRRVICVCGDGGLMMNAQELSTVSHHRLPVKIFLLNNGGYLTMRQSQENAFDRYMGSDSTSGLSFPQFAMLSEAHGIPYVRMARLYDDILHTTLETSGPVFCEVPMDPNQPQIPKSINRREADGRIVQTAIEDAWPYLPREELAENLRT